MAITKETVLTKVEVIAETGDLQLQYSTRFSEDGVVASEGRYFRRSILRGQAVAGEGALVQSIAAAIWPLY